MDTDNNHADASRPDAHDPDADIAVARRVITQEADALAQLSETLDGSFSQAVSRIHQTTGRVICTGIGKSGHVARKIAATLASTGTPAYFVHSAEASHGDLGMITAEDCVLALSRSGETRELSDLIHYTRRHGVGLIAMTARADSVLGGSADLALLIPDIEEACAETRAPTTSTTLMMALGDALAVALLERRGFRADDFKTFHPGGKLGAALMTAREIMHDGEAMPLVAETASLADALHEISAKGFGCVGVLNAAGALAGVVTDGDIRRLLAADKRPDTAGLAMGSRSPITALESDYAAALLRVMNEKKITQIFILRDQVPVGVVHMHDLLLTGVA